MTSRQSRREFMGLAAASAAGILTRPAFSDAQPFTAAPFSPSAPLVDPDLVVVNAKVYTMDPAAPRAEAFAVRAAGSSPSGAARTCAGSLARERQTFDAKGMTIVPGFIDCHNHAGGTTLLYEVLVGNPFEVEFVTIDSIVQKLRAKAQQTPPGMWVDGLLLRRHEGQGQAAARSRTISTRCRRSIRWPCTTAAGTRRSTTSKALQLAGITRTRRIRRGERSIATRTVS